MPEIELDARCQQATCWPVTGSDDQGEYTVGAAVSLDVRWIDGRIQAPDPLGNTLVLDATVVVDREIPLGSIFQLVGGDGIYFEAVTSRTTPDINNRVVRRTLGLRRFRETLPAVMAATVQGKASRGQS
jgi:hypothetical protein